MNTGSVSTSIVCAAAAAVLTFGALLFGLPVVGLAPGPVAAWVVAACAALVAAGFVVTGENVIEHIVKTLLFGVPAGILWIVRPSEGCFFVSALIACSCGTGLSVVERRLVARQRRRAERATG